MSSLEGLAEQPCAVCATPLRPIWRGPWELAYEPVDGSGPIGGTPPPEYGDDPLTYLREHRLGIYAVVSCALYLGWLYPWEHCHRPAERPRLPPPPEHCGRPMQRGRDAHRCRICGEIDPDEDG